MVFDTTLQSTFDRPKSQNDRTSFQGLCNMPDAFLSAHPPYPHRNYGKDHYAYSIRRRPSPLCHQNIRTHRRTYIQQDNPYKSESAALYFRRTGTVSTQSYFPSVAPPNCNRAKLTNESSEMLCTSVAVTLSATEMPRASIWSDRIAIKSMSNPVPWHKMRYRP